MTEKQCKALQEAYLDLMNENDRLQAENDMLRDENAELRAERKAERRRLILMHQLNSLRIAG